MNWKFILWPFALIYGWVTRFRNFLFDIGVLQSKSYSIPVISIGNLSAGGTGKTPHVEYLIRLLKDEFKIAVLSRGYGRSTKGYVEVMVDSSSENVGDEPLQFKKKFPSVTVAVCEKRVHGIDRLIKEHQPTIILLDDAFQHRYVKPSINILLTSFSKPFYNDFLLPMGHLRESINGKARGSLIIVTKCPENLSEEKRSAIIQKISPLPTQQVCFSFIKYGEIVSFNHYNETGKDIYINHINHINHSVLLVCGIADPTQIEQHLRSKFSKVEKMVFPDHHHYTTADLKAIAGKFNNIAAREKIIITTEKDFMRLGLAQSQQLPFYYLPIEIDFDEKDKHAFNQYIIEHVRKNQTNR